MTTRVNGGIINDQTLTGSLRFFKMTGPFAWTVSDGTVNLGSYTSGGTQHPGPEYFVVGNNRPVPNSAAEHALKEISQKADIVIINMSPGLYGATSEIHFACSASAFGWGANADETDPTAAAADMQAAVRALGVKTVNISVGSANPLAAPVTTGANLASVVITEVPFVLA